MNALRMLRLPTVLAIGAAAVPHSASAQQLAVVSVNNEVGLAFSDLIKNYKEIPPQGNPAHDRENGSVPGFAISGSVMRNVGRVANLYASLVFRYSNGQITYNGATLGDNSPLIGESGLVQKDVRLEVGKGFLVTNSLLLTPVFQYGYHVWDRDIGYQETYSHSYIGGALQVDYALTPRFVARFRAGIATTVNPQIEIVDENEDVTAGLGIRPVYQLGGGLDYAWTNRIHLVADADFSHYSYGRSAGFGGGYFEPVSATNDLYVEGGIAYHF